MDIIRQAQQVVFGAVDVSDLAKAQEMLRSVIQDSSISTDERNLAKERLCLLLLQHGNSAEATPILASMGYRYRLADPIFTLIPPTTTTPVIGAGQQAKRKHDSIMPVCVLDNGLPSTVFTTLLHVFGPDSEFWSDHNYSPDPDSPSPYFSFVHKLQPVPTIESKKRARKGKRNPKNANRENKQTVEDDGNEQDQTSETTNTKPRANETEQGMDRVIDFVRRLAMQHLPHLASQLAQATAAEWWAHCRPHNSGHQMHFDSANEGQYQGKVRHPIVSSVVYLTANVGGATLVTTQTLKSTRIAHDGWLVRPSSNRLCMFDGSVLHGVVPGCGLSLDPTHRRTTLMIAFWDHLDYLPPIADCAPPFPNQPFPTDANWAAPFADLKKVEFGEGEGVAVADAIPIAPVYIDVDESRNQLDGVSLAALSHVPRYQLCFQGF